MLEKFIHVNSNNETLDFLSLGIYINYNELRDFEWQTKTNNDRITGFYKGVVKKTIPFVFNVGEEKADEIKDTFYEHFEVDVLKKEKGYFEINGYKYYCYLTKSTKSKYLISKGVLYISVEVTTDDASWIKETSYIADFKSKADQEFLKYPFTYPFKYTVSKQMNINNDSFTGTDAIIRFYGECSNPLIELSGNTYQINISLNDNEYAEIDTFNKTVYKYSSDGTKTNVFNYRDKEHDVFAKLPGGLITASSNKDFKADIVLIERRGEPRWS